MAGRNRQQPDIAGWSARRIFPLNGFEEATVRMEMVPWSNVAP